ncbi:MAG: phospho-N-acetylmuramoyl-pentapeptide-transferase [Lachnospiraceae bacterium]|nr:phospho-N-acetylmuramoyl-pentapeptide-transferase [Lachnospiraceae bacterium]
MLYNVLPFNPEYTTFIAMGLGFVITFLLMEFAAKYLPKDGGRAFAVEGEKSAGKPRGAGLYFIAVFAFVSALFSPMNTEYGFYLVLILIAMMTGFLDDASKSPWGEYLKGALDLVVAILVAIVFLVNNSSEITLSLFDKSFVMPKVVYGILAVIVIWASINVTNCSDGVDGLSGSVGIISLLGFYSVFFKSGAAKSFAPMILILVAALVAYLWFNATPSRLMMGDAGSRALGLFIAICALKSGDPFIFIPLALVFILDGGLGLLKVFLLRFLKIHILKNVRTPLHDQVRKVWGWSNTQCVYRFCIIQLVICAVVFFLI